MRTVKWNAFLSGLCGFAVALGVVAASAHADVTSEKGASILVFPKVRVDGTFDTIIQIANIGNNMVHARCFYVNATLTSIITGQPCGVPSATCAPQWQETDFNIWLTKQQPTHWVASEGRDSFSADFGSNDAGFPPGLVPPVISPFEGELKCVEVDDSDAPFTGNHLKGEATIESIADVTDLSTTGDVSKYNAIGIEGNPNNPPASNTLPLDGGTTYDACPANLIVNHFAGGANAVDPVADDLSGADSTVQSELTLVPCSENFETQTPTSSTIQFVVTNEFEEQFSASTTVNCFLSIFLTDIDSPTEDPIDSIHSVFSETVLGSAVATSKITPVVDFAGNSHAVIGVLERYTTVNADTARSIYNLHTNGDLIPATGPEQIILSND